MSNQSVRALNKGDAEFKGMYDGITHTIPAGSELIVPWDAAILWLGDPRLWNSETDRARAKEFERLRVRWGAIEGIDLNDRLPNIAIHLLSDGTEIQMLGVDPSATPIDVFGNGAEEDMSTDQRVTHLESQLAEAIARLNDLTGNGNVDASSLNSQPPSPATIDQPVVTTDTSDDLPTDGDTDAPVPVGAPSTSESPEASAVADKLAEIQARRNQ